MKTETKKSMKPIIVLLLGSVLLETPAAPGQQPPQAVGGLVRATNQPPEPPHLTKFNLDFRGGTPAELLKAIEKGLGKPINSIVPDEFANMKLPALKMVSVDVAEIFQALTRASAKVTWFDTQLGRGGGFGGGGRQSIETSYGFRTAGQPSDDAVWYFFYDKPPMQPENKEQKVCRFYNLGPYLESYKIDDITTAIETGWKMLAGETAFAGGGRGGDARQTGGRMMNETPRPTPTISFHKDTKLLIAVGDPEMLGLIDSVLRELSGDRKSTKATATTVGKGVEAPKQ